MNEALLRESAQRWGTPLYVTDLDAASAGAHAWREALPGALVAYAVKANPDPALLHRLAADGFGCEVVGPVELALALRAGTPPERIVVNGVGQTDDELAAALATGALVNAESLGALEALLKAAPGSGRIGLRINPALDVATHPHLATGAAASKFGIARSRPVSPSPARGRGRWPARSARRATSSPKASISDRRRGRGPCSRSATPARTAWRCRARTTAACARHRRSSRVARRG